MYAALTQTYPGYWGVGETDADALARVRKEGGRAPFILFRIADGYEEPYVDQMGRLFALPNAEIEALPRSERPAVIAEGWTIGARGKRTPIDPRTGEPLRGARA